MKNWALAVKRMTRLRRSKHITLVELSVRVGLGAAYLICLEMGRIKPIPEHVELIQRVVEEWADDDTIYAQSIKPLQF